jgi:hypothetical protein
MTTTSPNPLPRPLSSAPLVMNHVTNLCRCGKTFCMSEQDARRIVKRIQRRKGETNFVRFYECRWAGWHWTQKEDRFTEQKRAS